MKRKIKRVIMFVILISLTLTNITYAQPATWENIPYGPKVEDLKGKEDIIQNLQQMKKIRANLTVIEIAESSTEEQLKNAYKNLENYIQQLNIIRTNLENHKNTYNDSFPDIYFSEEISFVAESYIISIRNQQSLITALENSKAESKKLFYSNYLIPVYYYLTLGDQMVSYIDTYFVVL
jgi:anion-transporting  ArsA/GET3 family ATPase